jgi:anti-sigma-K factor RskA
MSSDYKNSADYGGREPTWRVAGAVVAAVALGVLAIYFNI